MRTAASKAEEAKRMRRTTERLERIEFEVLCAARAILWSARAAPTQEPPCIPARHTRRSPYRQEIPREGRTPKHPDESTVFVGADGSRAYDTTTAIAWTAKAPDGGIDVDCRVFSVREDVPHHVSHGGGTIDFGDVEGFLLELAHATTCRKCVSIPASSNAA